jgi:nitroreductase
MIDKRAPADYPILEAVKRRWSPRAFADQPVEAEKLLSILEAARWAASSANEQPWRFLVATKDHPEDYARLLDCLREKNRSWASRAPVLMLTIAKGHFRDDEASQNRHAWHDLGLAVGNLSLQATALGLYVHQMASIYPERAREVYGIPAGFEPVTALALGYLGDPEELPEDLRRKELAPRSRKPLSELVFSGGWGEPALFASGQDAPRS